jgi:hypothetical protein
MEGGTLTCIIIIIMILLLNDGWICHSLFVLTYKNWVSLWRWQGARVGDGVGVGICIGVGDGIGMGWVLELVLGS